MSSEKTFYANVRTDGNRMYMGRRLSKNKVKSCSLNASFSGLYKCERIAFINADKVFVSMGVEFVNVPCYTNARVAFMNVGKVTISSTMRL